MQKLLSGFLQLFCLLLDFTFQQLILNSYIITASSKSLFCFFSFSINPEVSSELGLAGDTRLLLDFCLLSVGSLAMCL